LQSVDIGRGEHVRGDGRDAGTGHGLYLMENAEGLTASVARDVSDGFGVELSIENDAL
jgi:hypothetical protein